MPDRLRFHPLVVADLEQATDWYDDISPDLGNRFRAHVDDRLDQVAQQPKFFASAFGDFRFALVPGFPYLVLYRESGDVIYVVGVFHSASDPAKWRKRAEES